MCVGLEYTTRGSQHNDSHKKSKKCLGTEFMMLWTPPSFLSSHYSSEPWSPRRHSWWKHRAPEPTEQSARPWCSAKVPDGTQKSVTYQIFEHCSKDFQFIVRSWWVPLGLVWGCSEVAVLVECDLTFRCMVNRVPSKAPYHTLSRNLRFGLELMLLQVHLKMFEAYRKMTYLKFFSMKNLCMTSPRF